MYRVFNMGIGFCVIVRQKDASAAMALLSKMRQAPVLIGMIEKGSRKVIYRDS
jgi:phosphoribosylaminoimidazole (AIR) synthetase